MFLPSCANRGGERDYGAVTTRSYFLALSAAAEAGAPPQSACREDAR